jgi:outer membrane receptor protein involved in Fe transport
MKTIVTTLSIVLTVCCCGGRVYAQYGKISGKIADKKTGEELIGVTVQLEGTSWGAVTDFEGKYLITHVTPGKYNVVFSYVSYQKKIVSGIEIKADDVTSLNLGLEEATHEIKEVVVTTEVKRENASGLLIQQKNAASISDGISADAIRRTPDRNTGDVLKRISGASVQDNRFAIIRGLNERYTAAYINGAPLPSSESDRKAFSFDLFPASLLDNVVVLKTATPDLPAEFAGGVIQINTRSIPDKNFQLLSVTGGYNAITTFKDQVYAKGGKLDFLGIDDGTRALPSAIPDDKNFPTLASDRAQLGRSMKNDWGLYNKSFLPNFGLQYSLGRVWDMKKSQLGAIFALTYNRNYSYSTTVRKQFDSNYDPTVPNQITEDYLDKNYVTQTLSGALANFAYKIGTDHQIGFKNLFSVNTEDRVILRTGTSTPLDPNPTMLQSSAVWFTSNKIYSGQLTGTHYFAAPKIKFNWIGSYSNVVRDIPDLRRNSYSRNKFGQTNEDTMYRANVAQSNVGPDYAGNIFYGSMAEQIYSMKMDVARAFDFKPIHLKNEIKAGVFAQDRSRDFLSRQLGYIKYAVPGSLTFPDSLLTLPPDKIFSSQNMGVTSPGYGGFALSNKYKPTDSYSASSKLFATYLMFDQKFRERIRLIWGVRMEKFEQYLFTTLDNKQPLNIARTQVDFLPSANLVYSVTENQNLRVSYSQTVNRPEFRELAPFAFYDFSTRFVVSGNSDLSRALIHNYDVRYEWYPGRGQLFSVSGFYKNFINPIEQIMRPDVTNEISYRNIKSATNSGMEIEWRLVVGALLNSPADHFLNKITLFSNVAIIRSKADVTGIAGAPTSTRPLQGQSPYIINAGIAYFDYNNGLSFAINYNKTGQRIAIVGTANEPDIWENGRDVIDIQLGKSFLKNRLDVRFNIKDVLAQDLYFFQDRNHNSRFDMTKDNHIWVTNFGQVLSINIGYKL